jgi:hypothetical protein
MLALGYMQAQPFVAKLRCKDSLGIELWDVERTPALFEHSQNCVLVPFRGGISSVKSIDQHSQLIPPILLVHNFMAHRPSRDNEIGAATEQKCSHSQENYPADRSAPLRAPGKHRPMI